MSVHDLTKERAAVEAIKALCAPEDYEIAIESETNLFEAIAKVIADIDECEMMAEGINSRIKALSERKTRLNQKVDYLRSAIQRAMELAELKSVKLPDVTVGLRNQAPGLQVVDETAIPGEFFKPVPPKLDRKLVLDALKAGQEIPGAMLDNGGHSIQFRRN